MRKLSMLWALGPFAVVGANAAACPVLGPWDAGECCDGRTANVVTVRIIGFRFEPADVHVHPGDVVRWINLDSAAHDTTHTPLSPPPLWASGEMEPGATFDFAFDVPPGAYDYWCSIHATSMLGRITVLRSEVARQRTPGMDHALPPLGTPVPEPGAAALALAGALAPLLGRRTCLPPAVRAAARSR